jgi:hypothetical protein
MKVYEDRFEIEVTAHDQKVTVSIDKPIDDQLRDMMLKTIEEKADLILDRSLDFFASAKEKYGVSYIDDLSTPQIIAREESLSLYWWSDKGEKNGDAVIGVDFNPHDLEPIGMTIGD